MDFVENYIKEMEEKEQEEKKLHPIKWYLDNFFMWVSYYLYDVPVGFYHNMKWYFKNLVLFSEQLYKWRPWDVSYDFELFAFTLEQLSNSISNGHEEEISAGKKVKAINELSGLIRELNTIEDKFYDDENFMKLSLEERSEKMNKYRDKVLNRIHRIIKGQKYSDLKVTKEEYKYKVSGHCYKNNDKTNWEKFCNDVMNLFIEVDRRDFNMQYFTKSISYIEIKYDTKEEAEAFVDAVIDKIPDTTFKLYLSEDTYTPYVEKFDGTGFEGWWD